MQLSTSIVGPRTVVTASGDLDLGTAAEFRTYLHAILDAGASALVLDLTAVEFLDSTILGVLVSVHRVLAGRGSGLAVVCPHERLLRIFRVTVLDRVFTILPAAPQVGSGAEVRAP